MVRQSLSEGDYPLEKTSVEYPAMFERVEAVSRTNIGICIADRINRRLVEGVAAQLGLDPLLLNESDLKKPDQILSVDMLVVDENLALSYREAAGLPKYRSDGMRPALVAVIPALSLAGPVFPDTEIEQPFDGLLALPQEPALVLAQLGVILYAHRAHVQRFDSAMEELHLNRRIFRSVTSSILVANAQQDDCPIVYVNPAFEVMTGYSIDDILGKNCRFLQNNDRDQPGLTLVREALDAKKGVVAVIRNYRKDGTMFWNELALSPIRDRQGAVTHWVGIQNDVSIRVTVEETLRESEKLAASGRLAASIAHEINNPLDAVMNLIYLARQEPGDGRRDQYLEAADKELRRVAHITAQSLRFYKQSSKPQAVRPVDLICSVLDVYGSQIANGAIALEQSDRKSEAIVCFESEIRQVFSNLIRNAVDAMKGKPGRLLVRSREATEWKTNSKGVLITVADTGAGIDPKSMAKIYTAFYTTKGINGTGLGLWVSSEIVQRHNGRLRVRSRRSESRSGTVFTLFLPYQTSAV
jgi:two-component system, sporulation sensor kinase C